PIGGADHTVADGAADAAALPDHHEIAGALRLALRAMRVAERVAAPAPAQAPPERMALAERAAGERAAALLDVMLAWERAHALESLLPMLPDAAIEAWHRVLFDGHTAMDSARGDHAESEITELIAAFAARATAASAADRMRL